MQRYNHIFGPVPSRRLGASLGVDLMPHKTCSLNCIYCECGATTNLTLEEGEYVPVEAVNREMSSRLHDLSETELDFITFSGAGEPTLHTGINRVIDFIKGERPGQRVAVITNGTLFYRPEVRERAARADLMIASLDAVSEKVFQKINRPHPELDRKRIIRGLAAMKREFAGRFWLEVFMVPGMNDSPEELEKLRDAVEAISPDRVQINTLDRPGAEPGVKTLSGESLAEIREALNSAEVISAQRKPKAGPASGPELNGADEKEAVTAVIQRRPCTVEDIMTFTSLGRNEVEMILKGLELEGRISRQRLSRGVFYGISAR